MLIYVHLITRPPQASPSLSLILLLMYETSSSAGSSPPAYPIDSSPPSSPNTRDYDSLDDKESGYLDPYAASTRAKKPFRPYEKKSVTVASFDTSSYGPTRYRALDEESTTVGGAVSDTAFDESLLLTDDVDGTEEDGAGDRSCDTINVGLDTIAMKPHIARERWEGLIEEILFGPEQINVIDLK